MAQMINFSIIRCVYIIYSLNLVYIIYYPSMYIKVICVRALRKYVRKRYVPLVV